MTRRSELAQELEAFVRAKLEELFPSPTSTERTATERRRAGGTGRPWPGTPASLRDGDGRDQRCYIDDQRIIDLHTKPSIIKAFRR